MSPVRHTRCVRPEWGRRPSVGSTQRHSGGGGGAGDVGGGGGRARSCIRGKGACSSAGWIERRSTASCHSALFVSTSSMSNHFSRVHGGQPVAGPSPQCSADPKATGLLPGTCEGAQQGVSSQCLICSGLQLRATRLVTFALVHGISTVGCTVLPRFEAFAAALATATVPPGAASACAPASRAGTPSWPCAPPSSRRFAPRGAAPVRICRPGTPCSASGARRAGSSRAASPGAGVAVLRLVQLPSSVRPRLPSWRCTTSMAAAQVPSGSPRAAAAAQRRPGLEPRTTRRRAARRVETCDRDRSFESSATTKSSVTVGYGGAIVLMLPLGVMPGPLGGVQPLTCRCMLAQQALLFPGL